MENNFQNQSNLVENQQKQPEISQEMPKSINDVKLPTLDDLGLSDNGINVGSDKDLSKLESEAGISTQEQPKEQKQRVYTQTELDAMKKGWKPKEYFHGDAENWKPAKEFLEKGELLEKITSQQKELYALRAATDRQTKMLSEQLNRTNQKEYDELMERRKSAFELQDYHTFERIDRQLHAMRVTNPQLGAYQPQYQPQQQQFNTPPMQQPGFVNYPTPGNYTQSQMNTTYQDPYVQPTYPMGQPQPQYQQPQQQSIDPALVEFAEENKDWFNESTPENAMMFQYATKKDQELMSQYPNLAIRDRLRLVKKSVDSFFASKMQSQQPSFPTVDTSTYTPKTNNASVDSIGYADMPAEVKHVIANMKKKFPGLDQNEYARNLVKKGLVNLN